MEYTIITTSTITGSQLDILATELAYPAEVYDEVTQENIPNPQTKIEFVASKLDEFVKEKTKRLFISAESKVLLLETEAQLAEYSELLDTNLSTQVVTEVQ